MYVRHLKIMGLGLLTLVGVMAMSAPAAQAKWLILLNKVSIKSLSLIVNHTEALHILVPELGLDIHCTTSKGSIEVSLSSEDKVLSGSNSSLLTGCEDSKFKTCTVGSPEEADGKIKVSGKTTFGMTGELLYALLQPLADIEYRGAKCPLAEAVEKLSGSLLICLLEPLTDLKLHLAHVVHQSVKFGESTAIIEGDTSKEPLLSLTDADPNATWAIHLVNL